MQHDDGLLMHTSVFKQSSSPAKVTQTTCAHCCCGSASNHTATVVLCLAAFAVHLLFLKHKLIPLCDMQGMPVEGPISLSPKAASGSDCVSGKQSPSLAAPETPSPPPPPPASFTDQIELLLAKRNAGAGTAYGSKRNLDAGLGQVDDTSFLSCL